MAWNSIYWDMLDKLYWSPQYFGMRSIPKSECVLTEDRVSVPIAYTNPKGPLYRRTKDAAQLRAHLHSQEEILNQVFDLTFAIAPDPVVHRALLSHLGVASGGSFVQIGRELRARYGWTGNVTEPDGFFISDQAAVGVELKLDSKSWDGQLLKYAALMAWEELYSGKREFLGLLYIVPESALARHWEYCGLDGPHVDANFLERNFSRELPRDIRKLLAEHRDNVESTLGRMTLHVISWAEFRERLLSIQRELDVTNAGEQTIFRLLEGLLAQLRVHKGTGLT